MGILRLSGNCEVEWEPCGSVGTQRLSGNPEVEWEP